MNGLTYSVQKSAVEQRDLDTDLLVFYVVDGGMSVDCQGENTCMKEGDVFLVNPGTEYSLHVTQDALYGRAGISLRVISEVTGGNIPVLFADSVHDSLHSYEEIRRIFFDLTAEYAAGPVKNTAAMDSLLLKLFACLAAGYEMDGSTGWSSGAEGDLRMQEILLYVLNHLSEDINLTDLAEKMYVSTSTLSRSFKKNTGAYFSDYVMQLRVRASLPLLEHSAQSLTDIALNCGFSGSTVFGRSFKKLMGMTPSEYREKKQSDQEDVLEREQQEEEAIRRTLLERGFEKAADSGENVVMDLRKGCGALEKVWDRVINAGNLYSLTKANIQYHILYLARHLHFESVRFWNVFSTKMMIVDAASQGRYSFDIIDQALDFLVNNHLKPFLDLGRRPDTAIRSKGNRVYWEEEYIEFPDRKSWETCVGAFLRHISDRYGTEELSGWTFELTRNIEHQEGGAPLYRGPGYDFFDAWQFLYRTVKSTAPRAMVGGISSIIDQDYEDTKTFWMRCTDAGCMPDFCSFTLFPWGVASSTAGSPGEKTRVRMMQQLMEETGLSGKKLFITEWNSSLSNRNFLNDSCFRAAYLVQKAGELAGETDLLAVMACSDWISHYPDIRGILNGGIGLLTRDTIRKPAYYGMEFLNRLGQDLIARGDRFIATRMKDGSIALLLFYYSRYPGADRIGDRDVSLQESRDLFTHMRPLKLEITIRNLSLTGTYKVKKRTLNRESGSILDEWGKFQFDPMLSREDVKYLGEITVPEISVERKAVGEDHLLHLSFTLEPEEVSLVYIMRADS